ncbi:MAG: hypothetical protein J0G29_02820 [Alphaproteobacteria bacterium]|nr:hypothetical protein [Alphaproteobacteria bacterium]OJV46338.1 MAG: hypothetical protein BGO28_03165 [Alphaproteobacteria bacterium 43-37]
MIVTLVLTLALIILLIFGLKWLILKTKSKFWKDDIGQDIHIKQIKRLDDRRALYLIEENGMEHLLLLGPQNERVIQSRPIGITLKQCKVDL